MRYHKFERIVNSDYPIIRVTYRNWYGKLIDRDIVKSFTDNNRFWVHMDNGSPVRPIEPIVTFYESDYKIYTINKNQ